MGNNLWVIIPLSWQVEIDLFPDLRSQKGRVGLVIRAVRGEELQVTLAVEKALEILKDNTVGLTKYASNA